ncbi:MAG: hypothetical protein NTV82_02445, partial [Candidatus Aminicenantes bacterium]|nr:hypothetical protein [Candidatus Aminicenantes bacterium]
MKKTIVLFLLILGLAFLIISTKVGVAFLALAAVGIFIIIGERKAEILDNWSALIRGAQGQRDKVITTTKELINISKAPSIEMKEEKV